LVIKAARPTRLALAKIRRYGGEISSPEQARNALPGVVRVLLESRLCGYDWPRFAD
jgi:hypothetical protein